MSENEIKLELNEKDMDKISAGKSLNTVLTELLSLAPQYPEILEIFNAYKKGDSGRAKVLLKQFEISHPELASIFND